MMSKQLFLVMLLRRRGLWYSVWYRKSHPRGWMMGSHNLMGIGATPGPYDRLGYSFYQAVEMIASGTLDFMKDAPDNTPTHISVALTEPRK